MLMLPQVVFLVDIDNTLIDNDGFAADLSVRLCQQFGQSACDSYWSFYAALRARTGYADHLGAVQLFRAGREDDPALPGLSSYLLDYPFWEKIYPRVPVLLKYLRTLGSTVIFADGDMVFQPRKILRSGLWEAVGGRVLVCLHKAAMVDAVQRRFPARHYVMIDDQLQALAAVKAVLAGRVTTILVRQGSDAARTDSSLTPPDIDVGHIGDLCDLQPGDFRPAGLELLAATPSW
jgi:FMN phosphatase YigB (HAD superfamily)